MKIYCINWISTSIVSANKSRVHIFSSSSFLLVNIMHFVIIGSQIFLSNPVFYIFYNDYTRYKDF